MVVISPQTEIQPRKGAVQVFGWSAGSVHLQRRTRHRCPQLPIVEAYPLTWNTKIKVVGAVISQAGFYLPVSPEFFGNCMLELVIPEVPGEVASSLRTPSAHVACPALTCKPLLGQRASRR